MIRSRLCSMGPEEGPVGVVVRRLLGPEVVVRHLWDLLEEAAVI